MLKYMDVQMDLSYGNHICHSSVNWLSLDNAIIKIII